jgi:hypothetical protein
LEENILENFKTSDAVLVGTSIKYGDMIGKFLHAIGHRKKRGPSLKKGSLFFCIM